MASKPYISSNGGRAIFRGGPYNRSKLVVHHHGEYRVIKTPAIRRIEDTSEPYPNYEYGTYAPCTMAFENGDVPYVWMGWD
jgi:hypothetical protein